MLSSDIEVQRGLRRGCLLALAAFAMFAVGTGLATHVWADESTGSGSDATRLAYPNLGSNLSDLAELNEAPASDAAQSGGAGGAAGQSGTSAAQLAVSIQATGDIEQVVALIERHGGSVRNRIDGYLEAYVPLSALPALGQADGVVRVRELPPVRKLSSDTEETEVTSQGLATHLAQVWHDAGITGHGVKIGVIDPPSTAQGRDGFHGLRALMGSELPQTIHPRCYEDLGKPTADLANCDTAGGDYHGTRLAETVADLAPDATLYISNPLSPADLHQAVQWMQAEGVQVIVYGTNWPYHGAADGTSPTSPSPLSTVSWAANNGIVWVNAAGNNAEQTWFGAFQDADTDNRHEWSGTTEANTFSVEAGKSVMVFMRWDDTWVGATKDLRLEIVSDPGTASEQVLAYSDDIQSGQAEHVPNESVRFTATTSGQYGLVVKRIGGTAPSWLQVDIWRSKLTHRSAGYSIGSPADSAHEGMLAVGAARWNSTNQIESSSSRGPTPDNRTKPDLVGAHCTATKVEASFCGTSAAAAHVAGLAALVVQQHPNAQPSQITSYLKNHALKRGSGHPNNTWGYGFARLPSFACHEVLTENGPLFGHWTDDCTGPNHSNHSKRYYTFRLDQQRTVTMKLEAFAEGYLYLRQGFNTQLGPPLSEASGQGKSAVIRKQLGPGTYTIEATTLRGNQRGLFLLTSDGLPTLPAKPEVSVVSAGDITEGDDATFTVGVRPAPIMTQQVQLTLTQTGTYLTKAGAYTVTVPTSGEATLSGATIDDYVVEDDGTVSATILPAAGYTISPAAGAAMLNVVNDDQLPSKLTNLRATALSQSVQFTWDVPDGPILRYQIDYRPTTGNADWRTTFRLSYDVPAESEYLLQGLIANQQYRVRLRAHNRVGAGPWSDRVLVTPFGLPSPPTVSVQPQVGQLVVSWEDPTDGPPLTEYGVSWRLNEPGEPTQYDWTTDRAMTITDVEPGRTYTVRVRARSGVPLSEWSPPQQATVWRLTPTFDTFTLSYPFDHVDYFIRVDLPTPADRGVPPLTAIELQLRLAGEDSWDSAPSIRSTVLTSFLRPLSRGATHELRVRAVNQYWTGPWSEVQTATPPNYMGAPPVPEQLAVTPSQNVVGGLDLSWTIPAPTKYYEAEQYEVSYTNTTTDVTATQTTAKQQLSLTGLTAGDTYSVTVRSSNASGQSDWTAAVSAVATLRIP